MSENISTIPEGLHNLEYARYLLAEIIGWPATRRNLELLAESIESVNKSKRLSLRQACAYMERAVRLAREQGIKLDYFFFERGAYLEIRPKEIEIDRYEREKRLAAAFNEHGCNSGWVYEGSKVRRCPQCAKLSIG
jgi:glutaredoxin